MKPNPGIMPLLFILLSAVSPVPAASSSGETERFLQALRFVEGEDGAAKALERLDRFQSRGIGGPGDLQSLAERRIALLCRMGRIEEALDLLDDEFACKEVEPKTARRLYDSIEGIRKRKAIPTIHDHRLLEILDHFLANPALAREDETRSALLRKKGRLLRDRRYLDQAIPCFRQAACLAGNDEEKAVALFEAALAARELWDMKASDGFLEEIARLEKASLPTKMRARLLLGENAIYPVGHDSTPTHDALAKAHTLIESALAERSPIRQSEEAQRVLHTLILAETRGGALGKAISLGEKALDGSTRLPHDLAADIALLVAETYERLGDKAKALKYYERAFGGETPDKTLHLRIADLAIATGRLTRAVQAYGDAIACCDTVQEKGQIRRLTKRIARLNDRIHRNERTIDSERFFSDTDEELEELTLDED